MATKIDLEKLHEAYDRARNKAQAERYSMERDWFRNVLYFCLAGETQIPLLDGSVRPIHSLMGSDPVWVYGFDLDSLRIVPALMESVWQTGEKECVTVLLDNGESCTCTSDHRILTWFGYQEAGKLLPGSPLVPYREKYYRASSEGGYNQIFQPYDAEWQLTHRMVAGAIYGDIGESVVHHVNEIKTDNRPDNLQPMLRRDHSTLTLERHKEKIVAAVREWKQRPENRKAAAERASKQWADNYDHMLAANHAFRSKPEYLQNLREKVKAFWADPAKKAKRIEQMRARWDEKKKAINCRVVSVEPAGSMPVFDASVPATNNFAINSGVFVHNCGIQWIVYSPQTRKWKPRKIAKWVPRPVTNKFASIASTIMQVLSSKEPDTRARPGSDNPEDVAAAQVADRNFDVILKEAEADEARNIAGAWLTLTGNVIFHPGYDNDPKHGTTFVQHLQCAECGNTVPPDQAGKPVPMASPNGGLLGATSNDMRPSIRPNGGNGAATPMPLPLGAPPELPQDQVGEMSEASCPKCGSSNMNPAQNQDGQQIGEELPNGKMKLEVFSPFETFIDMEARSMSEVQELLVRRRYPLDVIRRKYNKPDLEGDNNSNVGGSIGLNLLRAIAYAAGNAMFGTGIASGRNVGDDQSITVDLLWKRPCTEFPEGAVGVYANELLLNDETVNDGLPYRDREGTPIWPWHMVRFDRVPGRMFGRTPMDDIAPKQEQRNKLESLIQLIISRSANPVWLMAKGTGVTEITGEPGQMIEGNWAMDPKLKPERIGGENVPTSVIAWLEKIDSDMEAIAGCLTGDTPIPCLDGQTRTMKELSDQFPHGGMWVYGFDRKQMRVVPAEIKRAWMTKVDKCVRVHFKEGTHVDCTPDHPFLTWERGYVRADELREDEPIIPCVIRKIHAGYDSVLQPTEGKFELVHRMVAHEIFGLPRDSKWSIHVHHKDEHKRNNVPGNLEPLTPSEHLRLREPTGFMLDPKRHSPERQSKKSRQRWAGSTKASRRESVAAMLAGRQKAFDAMSPGELSAHGARAWRNKTQEDRLEIIRRGIAHRPKRANHRVYHVEVLPGEQDVYDLTTSVYNFGTSAGVFVHNTYDVLRGNAPNGITAGTALRLLLERAVTRFTPTIKEFEHGWEAICKDLLVIFQQFASAERIAKIQGAGNTWEIERFSKSDVNGSIDIVVEAGSAVPKSTVGDQALIQDLTSSGVINPQAPETQYKILEKFGSTGLLGDTDLNIRYAQRENWKFINDGTVPVLNRIIDVHPVHLMIHKQYALSSDFDKAPEQQRNLWMNHIIEHMVAMMPAPVTAQPGAPGPAGPGGPVPSGQDQPTGPQGAPGMPPSSASVGQDTSMPPAPEGM